MTESAKLTIGPKKKVHQDWFDEHDERIKELMDGKKKAFIEWQNGISFTSNSDRFKHFQRQAQAALRRIQGEWWEKKVDEIKTYAATKNSKMFFGAIKDVYGPTKPRTTPLLSADGSTLLKEKSSINTRWRQHFNTLLNRPSTVDPNVLDQIPQKLVITIWSLASKSPVNKFAEASCLFGLTISLGKTEVLFQPAPAAVTHRPTISTDGIQPKMVDDF